MVRTPHIGSQSLSPTYCVYLHKIVPNLSDSGALSLKNMASICLTDYPGLSKGKEKLSM